MKTTSVKRRVLEANLEATRSTAYSSDGDVDEHTRSLGIPRRKRSRHTLAELDLTNQLLLIHSDSWRVILYERSSVACCRWGSYHELDEP